MKYFFLLLICTISCFGELHRRESQPKPLHGYREVLFGDLRASGSGQFSLGSLEYILSLHPKEPLTIVDLRAEFHGFSDGNPVDWAVSKEGYTQECFQYNFDISQEELEKKEELLLSEEAVLLSEKKLIQSLNVPIKYLRLPLTDHTYPSDEQVDFFLSWLKTLPTSSRIHFHCAGGKGRTSVMLCMIDMLKRAHLVSANIILDEHTAFRSTPLYDPTVLASPQKKSRYAFLLRFHKYCIETRDHPETWSSWIQKSTL